MVESANAIWADGPTSQPSEPQKAQIRAWGTWVESLVSLAFSSGKGYATRAALFANLVPAANDIAIVSGDPTDGYDGLYMKVGATTTGSWTQLLDFVPGTQFVRGTDAGAGTPDAIQATTSLPVSSTAGQLIVTNIFEPNTATAPTISFNGGTALTIKKQRGGDFLAGELPPLLLGYVTGSTFQSIFDLPDEATLTAISDIAAAFGDLDTLNAAMAAAVAATGADRLATADDVVTVANYLSTISGYTRTFVDTTAGLAGTTTGQSFTIPAIDVTNALALYNNVAGVAVDTTQRIPFWVTEARAVANLIDKTDAFARAPSTSKVATDNSATSNLAVSISGGLRLAPASATGYVGLLLADQSDGPISLEYDVTFTTSFGASSRGIGFAVGTGAARRWYAWAASGSVLERNQDGVTTITNFGTAAARILAQGNNVTVGLVINADRTGFLTMTLPDGTTKQSCLLGSIPTGPIYVAAFGASGNIFTATAARWIGKRTAEKTNVAGVPANDNSDPLDSLISRTLIGNTSSVPAEFSAAPIAGNKIYMLHATGANAHPCVLKTVLTSTPAPMRISASYKLLVTGTAAWAVMAIGEGAARHFLIYSITGGVVIFDNTGAVVSTLAGATASQAYAVGDTVGITLDIMPDRSGILSITTPSGGVVRYPYAAVPAGSVSLGIKSSTAGCSYEISNFTWKGTVSRLASLTRAASSATFLTYTILPNVAGGAPSGGATYTGLCRITSGVYAGCWLASIDGRTVEGDGSTYNAQVAILPPDFGRALVVFTLGVAATSAQGVVFNKTTGNSFWVALPNNGSIRHFYLSGVNAGTEIVADRITWAYAGSPNGLGYDQGNTALWVSDEGSATFRLLSAATATIGNLLRSETVQTTADHLHFDETNGLLYYSVGNNGVDGSVYYIDLAHTSVGPHLVYGPLKYCQAIEGIDVDRENGILTVINDGGYHTAASPALNIAIKYKVPLLAA
ncbi:hypothetical protein NKH61_05125 [Mesorhizobium sp. M1005]|uniref:hypothetical protein n=1 Tax=unclassified Mesorhizobium TaxID=325217 RepID=UPI003335DBC5